MPNVVRARDREPDPPGLPTRWNEDVPRSGGLRAYFDVLRPRLPLIAIVTAVAVGSALLFVVRADKVYEAKADILVTPIPRVNTNLYGLGLVSESGEPTRDAETLSQLITTAEIAEKVRRAVGTDQSASSLLGDVKAQPVAQSSIVTITARANDPELAAQIANEFGRTAIEVRTARMHALLDDLIPRLREQLAGVPAAETSAREAISSRLRDLEALRLLPDPTLHFETRAAVPTSSVAPRPLVSLVAALIGGLILSIGWILIAHVLDPRLEREEDLHRYGIPIVARIPQQRRQRLARREPLLPEKLDPAIHDAFHRFASTLVASAPEDKRSLFVTSPGAHEGKTTTSLNLAVSLAELGENVVLVDADSRQPAIGRVLANAPERGLDDFVLGRTALAETLMRDAKLPQGVTVLPQTSTDRGAVPIPPEAADRLVREATARKRWLVLDGPALSFAPETLTLAKRADRVVVVARVRGTKLRDLGDLLELLHQQRIVPSGFVLVGGRPRPVYWRREDAAAAS